MAGQATRSVRFALGLLVCSAPAAAQVRFDVTHSFAAPGAVRPYGTLIQGLDGNFYGTTREGGESDLGTIFKLTLGGSITILHSFSGVGADRGTPYAGLIQATDGNFYGTTAGGVYKMTPAGAVTNLHSFEFFTEGFPYAALIQANDGDLYGTTSQGGPSGKGGVFRVTLGGVFTMLHAFGGAADGSYAYGGLVQAGDGNLWGMTNTGGTSNYGVVFKMTTAGVYTPVHSFTITDGAYPIGGFSLGLDGALYGMTSDGGSFFGGTIFKITTSGTFTKLFDFNGSAGRTTTSTLIRATDGNFYGTAQYGGLNYGTVFQLTPAGIVTVLHNFTNTDGAYPYAGLYQGVDGFLYGTTVGGTANSAGTAFKVSIGGSGFASLVAFNGGADGASPRPGVIVGADGNFYGVSSAGGSSDYGVVFKMTTGGEITILHSFVNQEDGKQPGTALLQAVDGYFYGTTGYTVFKIASDGTFFTLHTLLSGTEGVGPSALIQGIDGNFYFTTLAFGAGSNGCVLKMTPGGVVTVLHSFAGGTGDGATPFSALVQATDGNFYGTTLYGGAFNNGTIFRVTPGGVFTLLHSFQSSVDGATPFAPLLQAADGDLYGLTSEGGPPTSSGTAFKTTLVGAFTLLHAFNNYAGGLTPIAGLVQGPGGNLYGTTQLGGTLNFGAVIKMTPSGTVTVLHAFSGTDGNGPYGTLVLSNGNFYGTTYFGGANGFGVVFHLQVETIGDFNLDLKGDLLLRNKSTGQNIGWLMDGTSVASSAFLSTIADTNWEIKGTGDLDANGKADVIWRNKVTGQNIGWLIDGLTITAAAFLPTIADTNWEIKGVGDFNGDGKADVIWRNKATGQNIAWLMNGLTVSLAAFLPTIADTNWEIKGVGDFDADGKADVIWRNKSTGQDIVWLMNGAAVGTAAFTTTVVDTNWDIVGVGDVSGDGKADVVWRNKSTGGNVGWLMNGATVSAFGSLPTIADLNWEIKGVRDFDADGKADVVWRNKSTGQNIVWLMDGLTVATSAFLPTIADTNWEIVGQ